MTGLSGKVIIVTGASSGIGNAAARLFAKSGANVIATARRNPELERLRLDIRDCQGSIVPVPGDVTDLSLHESLVHTAVQEFGRLDGAFNNAGTLGSTTPIEETSIESWNETINTNLTSALLAAKTQVPQMRQDGGGSIVFTSTFVGYTAAFAGMSAYAASKAGMIGLVKVLAVECAKSRIRVNAIAAGGVDTPMGRESASTPEARAYVESLHAMKRIAQPEEIAASASFLLSDDASFVTGSTMMVEGGISINRG